MPAALELRHAALATALLVVSCEAHATMGCRPGQTTDALRPIDARAVVQLGGNRYLAATDGRTPGQGLHASVEAANVRLGLAARRLAQAPACELRS